MRGYEQSSLDSVLTKAELAEEEFLAEFPDLDAALFAAYEQTGKQVHALAAADCPVGVSWPKRVGGGLKRLLEAIASKPELAAAMTRAFPAIGPRAYAQYVALVSSFVPYMQEGRDLSDAGEELPGEVELLAIGAAESIIFAELDAGRAEQLPAMTQEILFSILVPFIGPERAGEEIRAA